MEGWRESASQEERVVQQKWAEMRGRVDPPTAAVDEEPFVPIPINFDDDDDAGVALPPITAVLPPLKKRAVAKKKVAAVVEPPPAPQALVAPPVGQEYTGFVRYCVYASLYDVDKSVIEAPDPTVDTPDVCRAKVFAADAALAAALYDSDVLKPLVERLYSRLDGIVPLHFHQRLRRNLLLKRPAPTTLVVAGMPALTLTSVDQADLLVLAHMVYHAKAYVKRAVKTALGAMDERQYADKTVAQVWELLTTTTASGSGFARDVDLVRDAINAAQVWL